jgi:hypothetical protein
MTNVTPRGALRAVAGAALAALATAGCEESVELGSACAPVESPLGCAQEHPGGEVSIVRPSGSDTDSVPDRGTVVGPSSDAAAAVSVVPAGDAGIAVRKDSLLVENPSFERNGGVGGDVLLDKLISLFPLVNLVFADLPSWYACFPLAVSSVTLLDSPDAGIAPSPTGDYLSFVVNGTSVRQQLPAPMVPGAAYAFAFDVISDEPELYLEARGATALCGDGVVLGRSPVLPTSGTWAPSCVTFTADQAYDYLLLAPGHEGRAPGLTSRVRIDGLRQVESCP